MLRTHDANDNTLSLDKIISLRSEGFAQLRCLADQIATLGTALEAVDAALQVQMVNRSADQQQALVAASRHLSDILNGPSESFIETVEFPPITDHERDIQSEHFEAWLAQATDEEIAGLRLSQEAVAATGGVW